MSLALIKLMALGGVGCGLIIPSTMLFVKGFYATKGFLIAKSKNDDVQLYIRAKEVEEKEGVPVVKEYELVAEYKGKKVQGNWMLCSPEQNTNKYFLLKSVTENYHTSWKSMVDEKGRICKSLWDNEGLGDPLTIKLAERTKTNIPKEIYLQHCQINDLRANSAQDMTNKPLLELNCSEDQWNGNNKTVKLLDQGFIYI